MKKMMFVVVAMAVLLMGCGKEERSIEQSPTGFNEIQVEHIYTENVITENIIVENVVTENVITWDN